MVTSNEIKSFINKKYFINSNKIKVIPNAIDINKFKKLKTRKYTNRAITISRLEKQKNIFTLLNICELSNLNLDIIGTGTQLNEIKKFAKRKFRCKIFWSNRK